MARFEDAVKLLMATFLLSKITADEVGEDKALETLGKWAYGMYHRTFGDKKKQLGASGDTLKDVYLWLRAAGDDLGAVYEIDEDLLASIDRLEWYPEFYQRIMIETSFGSTWMYVVNESLCVEKIKISGTWL